jgi:hypothetical protein
VSDYFVEEIGMAGDGIVCADRSAAGLPMIVPPVRGDLDVVLSLRKEAAALRSEVERLRLTLPAVVCEATKRAIDEIIRQGGGS